MDLALRGKRALVTGSTLGIGFAIAAGLAAEGAAVIINGRSTASVDRAVERIRQSTAQAEVTGIAADAASAEGAAAIFTKADRSISSSTISASSSPKASSRSPTPIGSASLIPMC